jgi:hypothetical protein
VLVRRAPTKNARQADPPNLWMGLAWFIGMGGVALGQLANIATSLTPRAGAPYVAGTLVLLGLSGIQFVLLALRSVSRGP